MSRTPFDPLSKELEKMQKHQQLSSDKREKLDEWATKWREAGPIRFAEEVLKIDPKTGDPLLLSPDQKEFLTDIWKNGVQFIIIAAGRGAGKTFVIAIYVIWRICTHEFYNISCMGGSSDQTKVIQRYFRGWERHCHGELPIIGKLPIIKNVKGEIKTALESSAYLFACSETSTRGEHTREFIVDEEAAGEKAGGGEYIEAALQTASTSKKLRIIKSSTAHYIHGDYYRTWIDFETLGYKRYRWSLARHISGETDPYKIYHDKNPSHWFSNVPWVIDETVQQQRRQMVVDEKWLVEILGGISIGSGLVFKPEDLSIAICSRCDAIPERNGECHPYEEGYCALPQFTMQLAGVPENDIPKSTSQCLQHILERVMGVDYGAGAAADAWTVFGRFRNYVFVLFSEELTGLTDSEKLDKITGAAKKWFVPIIRPDPAGYPYNNSLAERGLSIHELDVANEKEDYVYAGKKYSEAHLLVIPKAYEDLIRNLKTITYDKSGKIRKGHDHSYDSFIYGISYYEEVSSGGVGTDWSKYTGVNPFSRSEVVYTCPLCKSQFKTNACPNCGWKP